MNIYDTIKEGLRLARTSRSLWLFGFVVGVTGSGSSGGGDGGAATPGGIPADGSFLSAITAIVAIVVLVVAIRILCEGALIAGIWRARRNEKLGVREGIREGSAHWSAIFVIDIVYFLACLVSVVVLAAPGLFAARLLGEVRAAVMLGIPAVIIGVPLLVTFYIWQAYAKRIAVLENRRASDAIHKARLFLHGRLWEGLKLMIASLLGTIFATLMAILIIAPFVLLCVVIFRVAGPVTVLLSAPVLLPAIFIAVAIIGTFRSSIWTIGYLNQVEASS